MIRVKMLPKNEVCIIDNGKSYLFNLSGLCYQEDAGLTPKLTTGMVELPIISLLSSNGKLDIGLFNNKGVEMKRYNSTLEAMNCAMALQMRGGFIKMLRRDGISSNNIKYNQLLFLYKEGTDLDNFLSAIQAKEVSD